MATDFFSFGQYYKTRLRLRELNFHWILLHKVFISWTRMCPKILLLAIIAVVGGLVSQIWSYPLDNNQPEYDLQGVPEDYAIYNQNEE